MVAVVLQDRPNEEPSSIDWRRLKGVCLLPSDLQVLWTHLRVRIAPFCRAGRAVECWALYKFIQLVCHGSRCITYIAIHRPKPVFLEANNRDMADLPIQDSGAGRRMMEILVKWRKELGDDLPNSAIDGIHDGKMARIRLLDLNEMVVGLPRGHRSGLWRSREVRKMSA